MYLSNGYVTIDDPMVRDLWRSKDGREWEMVLANTPYDGHSAIAVHNNRIFAAKNTVWMSSDGEYWELISGYGPTTDPDALARMISFKGYLWFFYLDQVSSSVDGTTWTATSAPFGRRGGYAVVADENYIYVLGGSTLTPNLPPETAYPERTSLNDVWRSSDGVNWVRLVKHAPWSPRIWPGAVVHRGSIYLFGGFDNIAGDNIGELWKSDDGANWQRVVTALEPPKRHWPSLFSFKNSLYMVAGNGWPVRNDVWRLESSNPILRALPF